MTRRGKTVAVALSGGVDSSATAALLGRAGYDCFGVFMLTCDGSHRARRDAQEVARRLGIELHILDLRSEFTGILEYFCREYRRGRTPNPCVVCNRLIKFGRLREFAAERGAEYMATGHYARILARDGRAGLYESAHPRKDQSYVLSMVNRRVFERVLLPMGEHTKEQAREIAVELGLGTEKQAESQEICFIPDDDYVAALESYEPQLAREGQIVDSTGRVLGTHGGIHRYTIGQRRGLGVAMGTPHYVTGLDPTQNRVILGPRQEVMHRRLRATRVNWLIDAPSAAFSGTVKIRYNDPGRPATVHPEGHQVWVTFDEPNKAITPGQLAVFYVPDDGLRRVAGAGWIEEAAD